MVKRNKIGLGKKSVIFSTIIITLLFVSSATAVPQTNGVVVVEKIDQIKKVEAISFLIDELEGNIVLNSKESQYYTVYILGVITELIISKYVNKNNNFDLSDIKINLEKIENKEIDEKDIISKTQNCVSSIISVINEKINNKDVFSTEKQIYSTIQTYLKKVQMYLDNLEINSKLILEAGNKILQRLISILLTVLIIPILMFFGAIKGFFGLTSGLIRVLGKLVRIIIIIFAGIQTALTITAFFVLFLGIVSKFGLRIFSALGLPFAAIISSILTLLTGSLLGNLSLVLSSIVALLLIFAIPILIAGIAFVLYYLLTQDTNGDENPPDNPFFNKIILTTFGFLNKIPGLENILRLLWIWIGNHFISLPEWPF